MKNKSSASWIIWFGILITFIVVALVTLKLKEYELLSREQQAWYLDHEVWVADPNHPIPTVEQIQRALVVRGYDIGDYGVDGDIADCDTERAWERAVCDQHAVAIWKKMKAHKLDKERTE